MFNAAAEPSQPEDNLLSRITPPPQPATPPAEEPFTWNKPATLQEALSRIKPEAPEEKIEETPPAKKKKKVKEPAQEEQVEPLNLKELRKKGRLRIPLWRTILPLFGLVVLLAGLYLFFAYEVPSRLKEVPFVARVFFPTATITPTLYPHAHGDPHTVSHAYTHASSHRHIHAHHHPHRATRIRRWPHHFLLQPQHSHHRSLPGQRRRLRADQPDR